MLEKHEAPSNLIQKTRTSVTFLFKSNFELNAFNTTQSHEESLNLGLHSIDNQKEASPHLQQDWGEMEEEEEKKRKGGEFPSCPSVDKKNIHNMQYYLKPNSVYLQGVFK